jgi:hypothetical protein
MFCGIMACTSGLKRPQTAVPIMTLKNGLLAFGADVGDLPPPSDRARILQNVFADISKLCFGMPRKSAVDPRLSA